MFGELSELKKCLVNYLKNSNHEAEFGVRNIEV